MAKSKRRRKPFPFRIVATIVLVLLFLIAAVVLYRLYRLDRQHYERVAELVGQPAPPLERIDACQSYLNEHPRGLHRGEVEAWAAEAQLEVPDWTWSMIERTPSNDPDIAAARIAELLDFIEMFPEHARVVDAHQAIATYLPAWEWGRISPAPTVDADVASTRIEALESWLARFPEHALASAAKALRQRDQQVLVQHRQLDTLLSEMTKLTGFDTPSSYFSWCNEIAVVARKKCDGGTREQDWEVYQKEYGIDKNSSFGEKTRLRVRFDAEHKLWREKRQAICIREQMEAQVTAKQKPKDLLTQAEAVYVKVRALAHALRRGPTYYQKNGTWVAETWPEEPSAQQALENDELARRIAEWLKR